MFISRYWGFQVPTKVHVAYEVQPFSGAEEAFSREGGSRVAIDSSPMAVITTGFYSPTSRSGKRWNRRARLELCRGFAAAKKVISALVGEKVAGVMSVLPKAAVAVGGLKEMNPVAASDCSGSGDASAWMSIPTSPSLDKDNVVSKYAPDSSSSGILLDAVVVIKNSSKVANNDEMGVSFVFKSGRKMVIPMRQGLYSNLPASVERMHPLRSCQQVNSLQA